MADDIEKFFNKAFKKIEKQVEFASVLAANAIAADVKTGVERQLKADIDRPTPFTQKAFKITRANKRTKTATVSIKPVQVKSIAERPPMYHPPLPYPMSLSEVDWEIMTPELMEQYLQNLENGDAPRRAYYSLSSKEYENLSMDMAEITRWSKDILSIIKYYREYDKPKKDIKDE